MATRSRGTSMGLVYGLVVFVILFVVCLAMTILFYAKYSKAEKAREEAVALNTQIASNSEQGSELFEQLLDKYRTERQNTVYGQLVLERRSLVNKVTGSTSMSPDDAITLAEQAGVGKGSTLVDAIRQAKAEVAAKDTALQELKKDATARDQRYAELDEKYQQAVAAHSAAMQKRLGEVKTIEESVQALQASTESALAEQVQQHETARGNMLAQLRQAQEQVQAKQEEIDRLKARIRELQRIAGIFLLDGPDMELEADGIATAVLPAENLVYISLGRKDRLILGMKFEVFDAAKGVILEERLGPGRVRELRGKATIEVVQMDDTSATCRVVRQAYGSQVVVGDLITNIVYDKARQFKFFVYGSFDLDKDQQSTIAEFEQVLSMVRQWGGVAVESEDHLPLDTDFLVLGDEPAVPQPIDPNETDPIIITRYQQQLEAARAYNRLAGQAEALSIPVLNQNRFLTLVGYFNR